MSESGETPPSIRAIKPLKFPGLVPNVIAKSDMRFEWVKPGSLFVEEAYQRSLSEKSITMVGRIVRNWNWSALKPPICAKTAGGKLVVIDGQHTAIAAATHGGIEKIPVMIVPAQDAKDRAMAFIRHNTERTQITHVQMHHAALAAGEEIAVAVDEACRKTNVVIRKSNPSCGVWGKNETVAIVSLRQIAEKKGVVGLTRVLKILVAARRSPIAALEVRALFHLLYQMKGVPSDSELATIIMGETVDRWNAWSQKASREAKMPAYRVLADRWAGA